jgi:hypothetical protein
VVPSNSDEDNLARESWRPWCAARLSAGQTHEVHIERSDMVGDHAAVWVRGVLRRVEPWSVTADEVARVGNIEPKAAVRLIAALRADGYVDADATLTVKGGALRMARMTRVKRRTAEGHLEALLERVVAANASERWGYWAEEVVLFGSMLDETLTHVGDVDVALRVAPRRSMSEEILLQRAAGAEGSETRESLLRHLKAHSTILSLCDTRDSVLVGALLRVVYRRPNGNWTPEGSYGMQERIGHPDDVSFGVLLKQAREGVRPNAAD